MKNSRKRQFVFSNVKDNKKAEGKSAFKSDEIFNLDNEIVIGLTPVLAPNKKKHSKKKNNNKRIAKKSSKQDNSYEKTSRESIEFSVYKKGIKKNKEDTNNKTKNRKNSNSNDSQKESEKNNSKKTGKIKNNSKINNKKKNMVRKRKWVVFRIIKWTTFIVIIVGGCIYFLLSPIFNIKQINVVGNDQISADTIISLSQINIEQNMFKINKTESIKKLKENSYIDSVKISRKPFDKIQITVSERYTTFMISIGGGYAYINNQGYILELASVQKSVPIIEGYETGVEDIKLGNRLCINDLKKLDIVLQIIEAAESNDIIDLITAINISDSQDYKLIFGSENKSAYIGDCSMLGTRMLFVKTILERESGNSGEIFVNMELNSEYPYFREQV